MRSAGLGGAPEDRDEGGATHTSSRRGLPAQMILKKPSLRTHGSFEDPLQTFVTRGVTESEGDDQFVGIERQAIHSLR